MDSGQHMNRDPPPVWDKPRHDPRPLRKLTDGSQLTPFGRGEKRYAFRPANTYPCCSPLRTRSGPETGPQCDAGRSHSKVDWEETQRVMSTHLPHLHKNKPASSHCSVYEKALDATRRTLPQSKRKQKPRPNRPPEEVRLLEVEIADLYSTQTDPFTEVSIWPVTLGAG